jgi:hypothetical protein
MPTKSGPNYFARSFSKASSMAAKLVPLWRGGIRTLRLAALAQGRLRNGSRAFPVSSLHGIDKKTKDNTNVKGSGQESPLHMTPPYTSPIHVVAGGPSRVAGR